MSQWRGRLEENPELERAVDWLDRYYHLVIGALLLGFMLWNRVRSRENFVVDGEILFSGNDPWYHYRTTLYTVRNWPATMPFDPWTYFPHGTRSGQFGTLFDQIMATIALIVGLGSPTEETVRMVMLYVPPLFALAVAVVAYFLGRRMGGRVGGIVTVGVVALTSGRFLQRSTVGFADHHIAEALFQALAVLAVMVAVTAAQRDKPVYEQFAERAVGPLRSTVAWSVIAGVAITLYLWTWPPGVLLLGILGVYFLLQLSIEFLRGESPEHTAIAGAVTMATAGTLVLPAFRTLEITATDFSLLHPVMSYGVAFGCVFMAWLAREWERRDLERVFYPAAIGGILVVGAGLMAVLLPDVWGFFVNNVQRVIGFTTSETGSTVGEVQPLQARYIFPFYGFTAFIAGIGAALILVRQVTGRVRAEEFLLVVWAAFVTAATFTQGRFEYYLTVPVAVLTGYVVASIFRRVAADVRDNGIQTYQVVTVVAVLLVVFVPMVAVSAPTDPSPYEQPGNDIEGWTDGLNWFNESTPAEGEWGGANDDLDYYGTYEMRGDFDYEAGHYGVMSWWDYGHWITVQGEAIPNANPFQQGSVRAANFLLAPNETQAENVLQGIDEDDAQTRYVAVDWQMVGTSYGGKFGAPARFYNATVEEDENPGPYTRRINFPLQGGTGFFVQHRQAYYETTMARLYHFHGSAAEPEPVVVDWEVTENAQGEPVRRTPEGNQPAVRSFDNMQQARQYVENDSTSAIGGIGGIPAERVPAMEHYRLVGASEQQATESRDYNTDMLYTAFGLGLQTTSEPSREQCASNVGVTVGQGENRRAICLTEGTEGALQPSEPQWVKFFERVPGATIEGTGPANTTVRAQVQMENPAANETFTYTQRTTTDENGEFEMTVPYSTTGYDEYGPEQGYTNVSVRANSSYQFSAGPTQQNGNITVWSGTADVTEGQVIGENDSATTVELESSQVRVQNDDGGNETDANQTDGEQTDAGNETDTGGNETAGNESDGGSVDGNETDGGNETANGIAVAAEPTN